MKPPPPRAPPGTALSPVVMTEGRSQSPFRLCPLSHSPLLPSRSVAQPCLRTTVSWACQDRLAYPWPSPCCLLRVGAAAQSCRAPPDDVIFRPYNRIAGASLRHPLSGLGATSLRTTPSPWCSLDPESGAPTPYIIDAIALPRQSRAAMYRSPSELPVFPAAPNHFPTAPRTSSNQFPTTSLPSLTGIGRPPPPARHGSVSPASAMGLEVGAGWAMLLSWAR
jgi:hypothetical protein